MLMLGWKIQIIIIPVMHHCQIFQVEQYPEQMELPLILVPSKQMVQLLWIKRFQILWETKALLGNLVVLISRSMTIFLKMMDQVFNCHKKILRIMSTFSKQKSQGLMELIFDF